MSKVTNKAEILGIQDSSIKAIDIEEWGMTVHIKSFSGKTRQDFIMSYYNPDTGKVTDIQNIQGKLLILCLCDENGQLLFADPENIESDIEALMNKNASVIDRLFKEASRMNGIGDDDVKELEKNS